jgi:hypothetical protein
MKATSSRGNISWPVALMGLLGTILLLASTSAYGPGLSSDSITYLAAGENLAAGNGFRTYDGSFYYYWPPFFPLLLAFLNLICLPPVGSIRIINAFLFGLLIYLTGAMLRRYLRMLVLAIIGSMVVLLSPAVFRMAMYVLTDFLFSFLAILFLFALDRFARNQKTGTLAVSAAIVALAFLTRYIGLSMVLTGIIWLFFRQRDRLAERLRHTILFVSIAVLPICLWIVRNILIVGSPGGGREVSQNSLWSNLYAAGQVIAGWFLPSLISPPVQILIFVPAMTILGGICIFIIRRNRSEGPPTIIVLSSLFLVIYISLIIVIATATTIDMPNSRLLTPIFVPLIIVILFGLDTIISRRPGWLSGRYPILLLVLCMAAIYPAVRVIPKAISIYRNGIGFFGKKSWHESKILEHLRIHPVPAPVYSNGPEALYYYAGICAGESPQKFLCNSPRSKADNLDRFLKSASDGEWYLVWFNHLKRDYLYNIEELQLHFKLEEQARLADGVVYRVSSSSDSSRIDDTSI